MPNIEIKHLFKEKRFPDNELKIICLLLYLPIGLILITLRILLALCVVLIGCTLSDTSLIHKLVNKIACLALGITVTVENPEKKDNVEIYISNNLSVFDNIVVHAATGSVSNGPQMHPSLSKGLGIHYFGTQPNSDTFKRNVMQVITEQKMPVHFTPEDKITNGKSLLKFKAYPFTITNKIQPICLRVERPLFDIAVTTLGASFWSDVFFYMFSPVTNYKLKYLSAMEKKSLQDQEFSEIVRQNMAAELKVELCEFGAADVMEWEKRQLAEQQRPQTAGPRVVDPEVRRMAMQVKEVLPHVPLSAIYKDLNRTRNVDNTITNILEGRVYFIPEQPSTSNSSLNQQQNQSGIAADRGAISSTPSTSSAAPGGKDLFNTAASTFAKSANERSRSFHERKEQLIANARRRYIEKHNLDVPF